MFVPTTESPADHFYIQSAMQKWYYLLGTKMKKGNSEKFQKIYLYKIFDIAPEEVGTGDVHR